MESLGFYTYDLELGEDLFEELATSVDFEDVTSGRVGNHLVDADERGVPIVRTTTQYSSPAQRFAPVHREIAQAIERAASEDEQAQHPELSLNNALIEIYGRDYRKMGYHSDQALDLQEGSYIALYSCYERPDSRSALRTLVVKSKTTDERASIVLEHNSVVLFSLETNRRSAHKIVLESQPAASAPQNRWLGITLRCSATYLQFRDGQPCFEDGTPLQLADEQQRRAFYKLRGQENRDMGFAYPRLDYTISPADLLEPVG